MPPRLVRKEEEEGDAPCFLPLGAALPLLPLSEASARRLAEAGAATHAGEQQRAEQSAGRAATHAGSRNARAAGLTAAMGRGAGASLLGGLPPQRGGRARRRGPATMGGAALSCSLGQWPARWPWRVLGGGSSGADVGACRAWGGAGTKQRGVAA